MRQYHKNAKELCKRIDHAFLALQGVGYFAEAQFWCCGTCGRAAIPEESADKFVFYHEADYEMLMEHGECYIAWAGDGVDICRKLTEAGLAVDWDQDPDTRILVYIPTIN